MSEYVAIGIMSGSSLDGIDLALCRFELDSKFNWHYEILEAECVSYDSKWRVLLANADSLNGKELTKLDYVYGHLLGKTVCDFIERHHIKESIDLIASHGHTIFHEPNEKYTLQIGKGSVIAAETNLPVISDLRSADIARGGQGAPISSIGDFYLFSNYSYFLNLGGIANITTRKGEVLAAYDISGCNQVFNFLAKLASEENQYDEDGAIAREGTVHLELLTDLKTIYYHQRIPPKTLSNQYVRDEIIERVQRYDIHVNDKMRTFLEFLVLEIKKHIPPKAKVMVSGGGVHNQFLLKRMKEEVDADFVIPIQELIDYKEALIMAFMGVLRLRNEENIMSGITGASQNSISGAIHK